MVSKESDKKNIIIDPYEMLVAKLGRMSWNDISDPEKHIDKAETIVWFSQFRDFSDDIVKSVVIDGILNNEFHNITYIFNLVRSADFSNISSIETYSLLFKFVCTLPRTLENWIDDKDLAMSRNILGLLSQSYN